MTERPSYGELLAKAMTGRDARIANEFIATPDSHKLAYISAIGLAGGGPLTSKAIQEWYFSADRVNDILGFSEKFREWMPFSEMRDKDPDGFKTALARYLETPFAPKNTD